MTMQTGFVAATCLCNNIFPLQGFQFIIKIFEVKLSNLLTYYNLDNPKLESINCYIVAYREI